MKSRIDDKPSTSIDLILYRQEMNQLDTEHDQWFVHDFVHALSPEQPGMQISKRWKKQYQQLENIITGYNNGSSNTGPEHITQVFTASNGSAYMLLVLADKDNIDTNYFQLNQWSDDSQVTNASKLFVKHHHRFISQKNNYTYGFINITTTNTSKMATLLIQYNDDFDKSTVLDLEAKMIMCYDDGDNDNAITTTMIYIAPYNETSATQCRPLIDWSINTGLYIDNKFYLIGPKFVYIFQYIFKDSVNSKTKVNVTIKPLHQFIQCNSNQTTIPTISSNTTETGNSSIFSPIATNTLDPNETTSTEFTIDESTTEGSKTMIVIIIIIVVIIIVIIIVILIFFCLGKNKKGDGDKHSKKDKRSAKDKYAKNKSMKEGTKKDVDRSTNLKNKPEKSKVDADVSAGDNTSGGKYLYSVGGKSKIKSVAGDSKSKNINLMETKSKEKDSKGSIVAGSSAISGLSTLSKQSSSSSSIVAPPGNSSISYGGSILGGGPGGSSVISKLSSIKGGSSVFLNNKTRGRRSNVGSVRSKAQAKTVGGKEKRLKSKVSSVSTSMLKTAKSVASKSTKVLSVVKKK